MNGKNAKEAVERTLELNKLQSKIAELEKELLQLREEQLHHCESCDNLMQHDCLTLWLCPALGFVDPLRDGCSRWKERKNAQAVNEVKKTAQEVEAMLLPP